MIILMMWFNMRYKHKKRLIRCLLLKILKGEIVYAISAVALEINFSVFIVKDISIISV